MRKQIWKTAYIALFTVFLAVCGRAGDIDFNFEIPTIPYPPDITEVTNSPAVVGASTFKVSAKVDGQMQKTGKCDIVPKSNCTATDWYQIDDPTIVPNPPEIKSAKVFYYTNGDPSNAASVAMAYDSELGKWVGNVPISPTLIQGDTISYYVLAIDGRGNVASETPSTGEEPCSDIGSWDDTLSTPLVDSCAVATGYNQCNVNQPTGPGSCGSSYTLGDKAHDVCGEPNSSGVQSLITGANADKVDLLGITAGSGSSVICTKIGLGGPPPASTDNAPIEGYLMIFFNPDIPDPNPGDTHIENAYAITYAPEAVGSDPTLVKVLWSGDCVTNPNVSDPLACKLISAVGDHPDLKIGYQSGSLRFITKKSGTGSPYAVSYNLLGSSSGKSILVGITGEINLSGGTAFWISDLTAGFSYYNRNKTVAIEPPGEPPAPAITKTSCNTDGTSTGVKVCPKSTSQPSANKCRLDFRQSDMPDITDEYRVYRNTTDNSSSATSIGTVPDTSATSYNYQDSHSTMDGSTYYYYLTSYNSGASKETKMSNASKTNCTVEDWVAPAAPVITVAATPAGTTGKCEITWTVNAGDPSLSKFWLSRDGDPINYTNPMNAAAGLTTYSFTDSAELTNGVGYSYTVTAVDRGNNSTTSSPMTCTPADLKPPSSISSLLAGNIPGDIGVKMGWEASTEEDLAGYNAYWCSKATVDCKETGHYTKFNSSVLTNPSLEKNKTDVPGLGGTSGSGGDFCFYVEACDLSSNCSGFPPGGADNTNVKCFTLSEVADTIKPAFPQGVTCTAPAAGGQIDIEWTKVCKQSDGTWFSSAVPVEAPTDCLIPVPLDLTGYKVIFGPQGSVPGAAEAQCANIAGTTAAYNTVSIEHKSKMCGTTSVPLIDGTQYCYHVYGVDAYNNVSVDGAVSRMEVCCTPQDTLAPDPPVASMDSTDASCMPSWAAVDDKDGALKISYSVNRCEGTSCNGSSTWTSVASGIYQAAGLSITDEDIESTLSYTYCVTAKDFAQNESDIYPASSQPNCKVCTPGNQAKAPTNVTAGPSGESGANYGALVFWTKSVDDTGSASAGYKMYRCSNETCTTKTAISGKGCTDLAANSSAITGLGPTTPITLSGEPVGTWFYGVSFFSACTDETTESILTGDSAAISDSITIDAPPSTCETKCIHVATCKDYNDMNTSCSPVNVVDPTQKGTDDKYLLVPKTGVEVFVADASNQMVGTAATTDSNGNFHIVLDNNSGDVTLTDKYKIVMKVSAAEKSGVPCDENFYDTEGSCYLVLQKNVTLTDDDTKTTRTFGLNLPPAGGGRAEVGNPNCDSTIDTSDLALLKPAFGAEVGDPKYKTYLDFDGDGLIGLEDFLILKKFYSTALPEAPTFDATLCKPQ